MYMAQDRHSRSLLSENLRLKNTKSSIKNVLKMAIIIHTKRIVIFDFLGLNSCLKITPFLSIKRRLII